MKKATKGQVGMPITFSLLVILVIVIFSAGPLYGKDRNKGMQYVIRTDETDIVHNSLLCGRDFIEASMDFSVFQAIESMNPANVDFQNDEDELKNALSKNIKEEINKYTSSGTKKIYCIEREILLPSFISVEIEDLDSHMRVEAKTDRDLVVIESSDASNYFVDKIDADIGKIYKVNPLRMLSVAKQAYRSLSANSCSQRKTDKNVGDYHIIVSSKLNNGKCETKATVTFTAKRFPVVDKASGKAILKELSMDFIFEDQNQQHP
ncbi:MAG: hypothetical protein GXO64_00090 [Candidatus Micrarchaeota archaeon]|nr:hypothetical protein [Candidatus Micrarchaeota archaeon]